MDALSFFCYISYVKSRLLLILFFCTLFDLGFSQNTCEMGFTTDSLYDAKQNTFSLADGLVTPVFKNGSQIKLFKVGNRYYLSIEFKNNLYFDKTDDLEIKSGTKSMFQKGIKQQQKNKYTALFAFEIYKNYVGTLKDEGITSFVFNNTENSFSKPEVKEIKKIATCFYQTINVPTTKK